MADATELALRALKHRDRSRRELEQRLARERIPAEELAQALDALEASGVVSDGRFAQQRAQSLASRNAGDGLIRADLRRSGISPELVDAAVEALDAEGERAARIFVGRGGGDRALRYLAGKGFSRDALESLNVADPVD